MHVLLEVADGDAGPVQLHGHFARTRQVINTALNESLKVIVHTLHAELGVVGLEGDLGVVVALGIGDFGFAHLGHIFGPGLLVPFLLARVLGFKCEFS